jgi:hypothetical protein
MSLPDNEKIEYLVSFPKIISERIGGVAVPAQNPKALRKPRDSRAATVPSRA